MTRSDCLLAHHYGRTVAAGDTLVSRRGRKRATVLYVSAGYAYWATPDGACIANLAYWRAR